MDWNLLEKEINTSTAAIMQKKSIGSGRSPLLNVTPNININNNTGDMNTAMFNETNGVGASTNYNTTGSSMESNSTDTEYLKTLLTKQQMQIDYLEKSMNSIIQNNNDDKLNHSKSNMMLNRELELINRTLLTRVIALEEKLIEYFDENSHIDTKYSSKENVLQVLETSMNEIQKLHYSTELNSKKNSQLHVLVKSMLYGFTELMPIQHPSSGSSSGSGSINDIDETIYMNTTSSGSGSSYSKQSNQTRIDILLQNIPIGQAGQTGQTDVYEPIMSIMQDGVGDILTQFGERTKVEVVKTVQPMIHESRLQSEDRNNAVCVGYVCCLVLKCI